jgi:glyoxylase-like metal-dependent hydrolase (beta-lactamase superfamily II)
MFNMVSEAYPEHALPSVTYEKRMSLHINGEHIELVHFANGHTDGDSIVFLKKANIVHMGDHFFSGFFPFVDLEHGGDVEQLAKNVKAVIDVIDDDTVVIPGHGPLSSKADLVAFHGMIEGTVAEVKAMLAEDMWLEEMQDHGLSEKWQPWAGGFLTAGQWIELIYKSLENNE